MENNPKAVKALGFIVASNILQVLSYALSSWQESVFSVFSSLFFIIGAYQLSNAFKGSTRIFLKALFWVALISTPVLRFWNSELVYLIDSSQFEYFRYIFNASYFARNGIQLIAFVVWFANSSNRKVKSGLAPIIFILFFYITISSLLSFKLIAYTDTIKNIYAYGKYVSTLFEFIGLLILIGAYSASKQVTTALLMGMTGAILGIFIVLGNGFVTELAAFVGYIILLISLFSLKMHSNGLVDAKRLRIAALIAAIAMFVNMIPFMEWLGTGIEVIAYIIALSGYLKLNKSRGINSQVSGFGRGVWAMVLLLLATLIHAIPSFGIGEGIAAMLGLLVVVILATAWIKSLAAIKTESELSEEPEILEKKEPLNIEGFADNIGLLRALNLSQLAILIPPIVILVSIFLTVYSIGPDHQTPDASFGYIRFISCIPFGFIFPLMIWNRNKANFSSINAVGKMILNFQLTIFIFIALMQGLGFLVGKLPKDIVGDPLILSAIIGISTFLLGFFNLILIFTNTIRCKKLLKPWYQPAIPFFKVKELPVAELKASI